MNPATPFLYAAIFSGLIAAAALTISQVLRFKDSLEPRSKAVKPRQVNIRQ